MKAEVYLIRLHFKNGSSAWSNVYGSKVVADKVYDCLKKVYLDMGYFGVSRQKFKVDDIKPLEE